MEPYLQLEVSLLNGRDLPNMGTLVRSPSPFGAHAEIFFVGSGVPCS
jgi:hypothetical protein